MADGITVRLDGVGHDLDDFKFGELEWLEDYRGKPLSDDGVLSSKKAALGFVYLIRRRENPRFALDQR